MKTIRDSNSAVFNSPLSAARPVSPAIQRQWRQRATVWNRCGGNAPAAASSSQQQPAAASSQHHHQHTTNNTTNNTNTNTNSPGFFFMKDMTF